MRFFWKAKDGGPKSTVTGYWLAEIKSLVSAALLRFDDGTRDEYHSHAFNCISWVLRGKLVEEHLGGATVEHRPSLRPVVTRRETFHRVRSVGTTWVLTFRGPWTRTWFEFEPRTGDLVEMTHGREVVMRTPTNMRGLR